MCVCTDMWLEQDSAHGPDISLFVARSHQLSHLCYGACLLTQHSLPSPVPASRYAQRGGSGEAWRKGDMGQEHLGEVCWDTRWCQVLSMGVATEVLWALQQVGSDRHHAGQLQTSAWTPHCGLRCCPSSSWKRVSSCGKGVAGPGAAQQEQTFLFQGTMPTPSPPAPSPGSTLAGSPPRPMHTRAQKALCLLPPAARISTSPPCIALPSFFLIAKHLIALWQEGQEQMASLANGDE